MVVNHVPYLDIDIKDFHDMLTDEFAFGVYASDGQHRTGRNRRDPIATPTKPPVRGGSVTNATVTGGKSNWRRKGKK